jgi:Tol biopolymer transport system component
MIGEFQRQNSPTLSSDGRKLVVEVEESGSDLWVYDLERGGRTRLTSDPAFERLGAWTPRGDQITYIAFHNGTFDMVSKPSSGKGGAQGLMTTTFPVMDPAWSADGRFLLYAVNSPETKADLMWRERRGDGKLADAVVFLKTGYNEAAAQFSPDGRFVVYVSDESGSNEVYVRDFPIAAGKWRVSANGGMAPRWSRDGKEIFYVAQSSLMAASVTTGPYFSAAAPVRLFEKRYLRRAASGGVNLNPQYDVSADGRRFVILDRPGGEQPLSIHVVHNWFEEFRTRGQK